MAPLVQPSRTPEDDSPLLGNEPGHSGGEALVPHFTAHRRRFKALLRAAWDSGVACVCGAALVFSFAALLVKLLGSAIPVFEIVAFRSVTSFATCAAYARAAHISPLFGAHRNLPFLLSRGLFGAAAMTTYYFSIKMLPLADAVTIFFLNPAITAVAAWAIMREPLGPRGATGLLVSLCGLVLLTRPPFLFGSTAGGGGLHGDGGVGVGTAGAAGGGWDKQRLLGSMFGLLSAVLSAGAFISIRFIGKSEPALVLSVYFHVCAAASSAGPLVAGVPAAAVLPRGAQWALLAGVASCSFWGQILIGRGFQLLNAARASAINLTQVIYSYLLGLIFLHERLTLSGGGGSLLIAAGAVLVNLRPNKPPPQPPTTAQQPPAAEADAETAAAVAAIEKDGAADVVAAAAAGGGGGDDDGRGGSSGSSSGSGNRAAPTGRAVQDAELVATGGAGAGAGAGGAVEMEKLGGGGEGEGETEGWWRRAGLRTGRGGGPDVGSERRPLLSQPPQPPSSAELPGRSGRGDGDGGLEEAETARGVVGVGSTASVVGCSGLRVGGGAWERQGVSGRRVGRQPPEPGEGEGEGKEGWPARDCPEREHPLQSRQDEQQRQLGEAWCGDGG